MPNTAFCISSTHSQFLPVLVHNLYFISKLLIQRRRMTGSRHICSISCVGTFVFCFADPWRSTNLARRSTKGFLSFQSFYLLQEPGAFGFMLRGASVLFRKAGFCVIAAALVFLAVNLIFFLSGTTGGSSPLSKQLTCRSTKSLDFLVS